MSIVFDKAYPPWDVALEFHKNPDAFSYAHREGNESNPFKDVLDLSPEAEKKIAEDKSAIETSEKALEVAKETPKKVTEAKLENIKNELETLKQMAQSGDADTARKAARRVSQLARQVGEAIAEHSQKAPENVNVSAQLRKIAEGIYDTAASMGAVEQEQDLNSGVLLKNIEQAAGSIEPATRLREERRRFLGTSKYALSLAIDVAEEAERKEKAEKTKGPADKVQTENSISFAKRQMTNITA